MVLSAQLSSDEDETLNQASTPNVRLRHQAQCLDEASPASQFLQAWFAVAGEEGAFDTEGRQLMMLPDLCFGGDADVETSSQASCDPSECGEILQTRRSSCSSYDPSASNSRRGSLASFDGLSGLNDVRSIRSERSYDAEHLYFTDSEHSDNEIPWLITAMPPFTTMDQVEVDAIERLLKSEEAVELELSRLHYQLLLYMPDSPSQRQNNCNFLKIHAACHDDSWIATGDCDRDLLSPFEVSEEEWEEQLWNFFQRLHRQDEALLQLLIELREAVNGCGNRGGEDKMCGVTTERLDTSPPEYTIGMPCLLPPAGAGTPAPEEKAIAKASAATRLQELKRLLEIEKSLDAVLDTASCLVE